MVLPNIVFVVYPGIKLLDLSGPLQVFSDALNASGKPAYKTCIVSKRGGTVGTDTAISIASEPVKKWRRRKVDTLIIVGGDGVYDTLHDKHFMQSVSSLSLNSRRVASICSGAFILADCGLLDGKKAVTHWESCDRLKRTYPEVLVEEDSIYTTDGKFWTSAGVTAGIDMAIKMISDDLGNEAGLSIARSLVTYLVRPGGQSQFSQTLALQSSDNSGRFDGLNCWIQSNLHRDLNNQLLADRICMSARTFARLYTEKTGVTPAKAVESMRVEAASRMLTQTRQRINTIAKKCGFTTDERMRRAFLRQIGIMPRDYRVRFSEIP